MLKGRSVLLEHYKTAHPDYQSAYMKKKNAPAPVPGDTLSKIIEGEKLIKDALRDIDTERNILQNKLKELDDLAAKYKLPKA